MYTCVCVYIYIYIDCSYTRITNVSIMMIVIIGKLKLSCDVIVVSHFSHQVIVFERTHIKQQSPDRRTVKHHHIT